jgi:hypothetical protein
MGTRVGCVIHILWCLSGALTSHADISYTPVPGWATMGHDTHHTFMQLARLAHPATRARALGETGSRTAPAPQSSFVLAPDEQLLCFDFMYFVVAEETYEWEHEWSPMWHTVLKHMRWTAALEEIRDAALRTLLGVSADEPIPPVCLSPRFLVRAYAHKTVLAVHRCPRPPRRLRGPLPAR